MVRSKINFVLLVNFGIWADLSDLSESLIGKVGDLKNWISRLVVNQSSKFEKLLNTRWYDYIVLKFQAIPTRIEPMTNNFLRL